MIALLFLVYSLVEWYMAKKKTRASREKWTMLILIILLSAWNLFAVVNHRWITPNQLILLLFGWMDQF
ncbi:hypothetical protein AMS62_18050 [Bacillus sp. FJAT-18019]|nr:hypothetical protein AMS62_18050 [Bacillus sp. FJAT-18019]